MLCKAEGLRGAGALAAEVTPATCMPSAFGIPGHKIWCKNQPCWLQSLRLSLDREVKWLVSFAKRRSREVRLEFYIRFSVLELAQIYKLLHNYAYTCLVGYRAFILT